MPILPDGTQLPYPPGQSQPGMGGPPLPQPGMEQALGAPQPPQQQAPPSGPEILSLMLQMASVYAQGEEDEEDILAIEKARTLIQQLLAKNQKQADDLLQGKGSPAAFRRFARAS